MSDTQQFAPFGAGTAVPEWADPVCKRPKGQEGDCDNWIGVPAVLDETTTDCYGKPLGWCWYCWLQYENAALRARVDALSGRALPGGGEPAP